MGGAASWWEVVRGGGGGGSGSDGLGRWWEVVGGSGRWWEVVRGGIGSVFVWGGVSKLLLRDAPSATPRHFCVHPPASETARTIGDALGSRQIPRSF